ncbi:MAG: Holliday junction resolvase-like protein [Ignavibacteria bacterium]|nr:MAG: Holliday junction resolvase-like protein [Ignavibacteria bacterium]KAF0159889.1 MAG: Holliday junction resolvase-like protein [Ignavibacteria bacterium]
MKEERTIAIDFGAKRIGIAVTDPLNMFAYPLTTLLNDTKFIDNLKKILSQYSVVRIVVGMPYKESGEESATGKAVLEFVEMLRSKTSQEIILADERYSSAIALQRIIESVPSKKKRRDKSLIDKNAAAVLLEDYLRSIGK